MQNVQQIRRYGASCMLFKIPNMNANYVTTWQLVCMRHNDKSMKSEPECLFFILQARVMFSWVVGDSEICLSPVRETSVSGPHHFPPRYFQVIYRALSPWLSVDPYGQAAQKQLMITDLRVRLLRRQPCPCQTKHPAAAVLPTQHYAIYDFIVKGSCLCNGHADHCVRAEGYQAGLQKTKSTVSDLS